MRDLIGTAPLRLLSVAVLLVGATAVPAASAAAAGAAEATRPPGYRAIVLGTLGGPASVPRGLNDRGDVVGSAHTAAGAVHPFLWRHGRMIDLGTLDRVDGGWGLATDVNRHGTVVGQSRRAGQSRAVRWQHGRITDLGSLGGSYSSANAINDDGTIVGNSTTSDGTLHAFRWRHGRMIDLGVPVDGDVAAEDVNNRGEVVGWARPVGGPEVPYRWERGRVTFLPVPPSGGFAAAINERGQVVGSMSRPDVLLAVRWWHGRSLLLGTLPGGNSSAAGDVNDHGAVLGAGNVEPGSIDVRAFLWRRGVLHDLSTAGVPADVSRLNNRDELIGTVANSTGDGSLAVLFRPAPARR